MYCPSVKKILFPLVCALSLFLNIYFLSHSRSHQPIMIKEVSTVDVKNESNSTESVKTAEPDTDDIVPLETNNIVIRFLLLPSVSCNTSDVQLVICVPTVRDNLERRNAIRKTWGSYANSSSNAAILLFFVGLGENQDDKSIRRTLQFLELESKFYGDIVQGDYTDSYRNLTMKSLSILTWVTTFCPKSQFILKADDDVFVNVPLLVQTLKNTASKVNRFIMGEAQKGGHPHRDPTSKWFVAYTEYKEEMYPHFVLGPSYAMTTSAAKRLYKASRHVPFFYLEDVYITGLCARKSQVPVLHSGLFSNYKQPANGCFFRHHIAAHEYLPEEMIQIQKQLFDSSRPCLNNNSL